MYVVTVRFEIDAAHAAAFTAAIIDNARTSCAREPGCRQFDVCLGEPATPGAVPPVYLYEVYRDRAAFDAHLASEHFQHFDAATRTWVRDKQVQVYNRCWTLPAPGQDTPTADRNAGA